MNDESKVRRSTTPVVLGKAKVMSYEDLEEARAKRAEKEAAKEAKGKRKRGQKRKNAEPEADAPVLRFSKLTCPIAAPFTPFAELLSTGNVI
jgi:hypothetical protein